MIVDEGLFAKLMLNFPPKLYRGKYSRAVKGVDHHCTVGFMHIFYHQVAGARVCPNKMELVVKCVAQAYGISVKEVAHLQKVNDSCNSYWRRLVMLAELKELFERSRTQHEQAWLDPLAKLRKKLEKQEVLATAA